MTETRHLPSAGLLAVVLALAVLLGACTGTRLLPAPPEDRAALARIPGYPPNIRFYADQPFPDTDAELAAFRRQVARRVEREGALPNGGIADILVLSGGGSDGAYGAGLLNGWTDRADRERPDFVMVTGISTGALIAPLVFAGPDYDPALERFYTNTATQDVLDFVLFRALTGRALGLADTTRLADTVDRTLTPELIDRIAREHRKGRRLLVGTTNLDSQRPVTWNIGAIAASDNPDKRRLIRDILLASAAIPAALPPILFEVEVDGKRYTEMHVDGGVTRQLFSFPLQVAEAAERDGLGGEMLRGTVYVIRNTKLAPDFEPVEPGVVQIAARSVSTLIKSAGVADIAVVEDRVRRAGFGLKVTAVPESFDEVEEELFDIRYMRALYKTGYDAAFEGAPWVTILQSPDVTSLLPAN